MGTEENVALSARRIAEIRARAEAATPGPWYASTADSAGGGTIYEQDWAVAAATIYPDGIANSPTVEGHLPAFPSKRIDTDANARFIAHAREDIPALITAYEAAMAIVRVVASPADGPLLLLPAQGICVLCQQVWPANNLDDKHTQECPVTHARVILASMENSEHGNR